MMLSRLILLIALACALPAQAVVLEPTAPFPGSITPRGPKGDSGCSMIPTNGAPPASVGRDCDLAFDAAAGKVYGPKIAGQWGAGVVMSPVAAAQTLADRARYDREQARVSAADAATSAAAAASGASAAEAVQSWFEGLAPGNVLSTAHGGTGLSALGAGVASSLATAPNAAGGLKKYGGEIDALAEGCPDDNATNNTACVQTLLTRASSAYGTVVFRRSAAGSGKFRVGSLTCGNANLQFDEGAGWANLDGSPYNGVCQTTSWGFPDWAGHPYTAEVGRRTMWPGGAAISITQDRDNWGFYSEYNYSPAAPTPYHGTGNVRNYIGAGNAATTKGSTVNDWAATNWYDVRGPDSISFTCTATNGSATLSDCSPSPIATNPATGHPYLMTGYGNGADISSATSGLAAGALVDHGDASHLYLTIGQSNAASPWTGATGTVTFSVWSGRAEMNIISYWGHSVNNQANSGGDPRRKNFYNDIGQDTPSGPDQVGFLSAMNFFLTRRDQGMELDKLHNGHNGVNLSILPFMQNAGDTTYPVWDGIVSQGWSGPASTFNAGGWHGSATAAAVNAFRAGGAIQNDYGAPFMRSYFNFGFRAEDYDTAGVIVTTPHPAFLHSDTSAGHGSAILAESNAGEITSFDGFRVGNGAGVWNNSAGGSWWLSGDTGTSAKTKGGAMELFGSTAPSNASTVAVYKANVWQAWFGWGPYAATFNGKVNAQTYYASDVPGLTVTKTVRASGGASDCTLIFTGGLLTGGTC